MQRTAISLESLKRCKLWQNYSAYASRYEGDPEIRKEQLATARYSLAMPPFQAVNHGLLGFLGTIMEAPKQVIPRDVRGTVDK